MKVLEDFLTIEDDPEILNFRFECDDMLMWPFIRYLLFQDILLAREYNTFNTIETDTFNNYNKLKYIYHSFKHSPFQMKFSKPFRMIMFGSGVANTKVNTKYFHRVMDHFAFLHTDETLSIESSRNRKYLSPRHFPHVCYHDSIFIIGYIASKCKRSKSVDLQTIHNLIRYLQEKCDHTLNKSDLRYLETQLIRLSKVIHVYRCFYRRLFDRFKPEILFQEDASYGFNSFILKWAKERNIITVEPQHGALSKNHPAYNYGKAISSSGIYSQYLPDYFLSYGELWNDLMNFPVKKITVGNPNYSERLEEIDVQPDKRSKTRILILSAQTVSNLTVKMALDLVALTDETRFDIVFRPHPLEWPLIEKSYPELLTHERIQMDTEENLYASLLNADFAIGFNSTSLFEALGLCKAVYVFEHPGNELDMPRALFKRFPSVEELLHLIQSHSAEDEIDTDYIWEPNWEANYKRFMDGIL